MQKTKVCTKCHQIKPLENFAKDSKGKLGRRSDCKICNSNQSSQYQKKHVAQVSLRNRRWRDNNKAYISQYRKNHTEKARELARRRYAIDPVVRAKAIASSKDYRNNPINKEKIRATKAALQQKYRANPKWRLVSNIRRRLCYVLNGQRKTTATRKLVGCTWQQLRAHLESLFKDGMSWENYGQWHVDHIKPCASFDLSDPKQQESCFNYLNLRPLWAVDNLIKGAS